MSISRNRLATLFNKMAGQRIEWNDNLRFREIAEQWLENSEVLVKESSYIKYRNLLKNHILPEIGELTAEEITTECVSSLARRKLSEGRKDHRGGLSEKTVRDILTVLRNISNYANQHDIKIPCRFEWIRFRCKEGEVRILDKQERAALEQFLFQDESFASTGILISLYMGLRLGEICALKKENILYSEKILQVRFTMQRIQTREHCDDKKTKIIITEPKSDKSIRDIPIPDFLMSRFLIFRSIPKEAYLLTGREDKFIEPRTLENIFKRCLQKCGMPQINYHALRHTFATCCIEAGFDVKSLSEILGHSNVNTTLNRYVHSSMEQKRENMGKLSAAGRY